MQRNGVACNAHGARRRTPEMSDADYCASVDGEQVRQAGPVVVVIRWFLEWPFIGKVTSVQQADPFAPLESSAERMAFSHPCNGTSIQRGIEV